MLKIKRYDFSPILGWSISRYDMFSNCKRLYYYQYYAKFDPDYPRVKIDELKNLTSIPLEIGNIVHDTVSTVLRRLLKSKEEIDRQRFQTFVETMTAENCKNKVFFEVYYAERASVEPPDLLPSINECLTTFLASPRFQWIKDKAISSKNEWLIEPPGYGEARIDGMKVYCKVDFLFVVDGRIIILDWKTGKRVEEKHGKQLLGYTTWAAHHLNASAADIDAVIAYLRPSYEEVELSSSDSDLKNFASQIRAETEEMYAFCGEVQENVPLEKESFPMTSRLGFCKYCNFKELCDRV
jgi:CRISPR/Cas system-associated exonuclease Cas4 (RecB family)